MITKITHTTLIVPDQAEALAYYTEVFGLVKQMDQPMGPESNSRWLTVTPQDQPEVQILLEHYSWGTNGNVEKRKAQIGNYPGILFQVDDCAQTVAELKAKGVTVQLEPDKQDWGTQAMVQDKYGYTHVLVEPPTGE